GLVFTEQVPGSAYIQVSHRDFKTAAELSIFFDCFKPFFCNFSQHFIRLMEQVGITDPVAPPDASAQLVELAESETVRIFNDQSVGVRHIDTRFDDGCRDDDIEFIIDRKSTRLNSSHVSISYAVFCLKKKKEKCSTIGVNYS